MTPARRKLRRAGLYLVFAILNTCGFRHLLLHSKTQFGADWNGYFEPLSLFVRSAVWHYHALPLHNPWRCGGSDFLVNPQTRLFSPFGLLDIFLPAQMANLVSLMIYGYLGAASMFVLLEFLGVSVLTAAVGAVLFMNCGWLALHFTEGHITYGSMALLPFVFYCGLRLREKRHQFLLMATLALILLDGAIQPFIYAGMVLICAVYVRGHLTVASLRTIFKMRWSHLPFDLGFVARLGLIFLLLTACRIIPGAMSLHGRSPTVDLTVMSPQLLFTSLLYPWQEMRMTALTDGLPYAFHEFGSYLGWIPLAFFLFMLSRRMPRQENTRLFILTFFWFWTASGLGSHFNPWLIIRSIPIVQHAHLQSRLFIIMMIFFVVIAAKGLDLLRHRRSLWAIASLLIILEGFYVRFHITNTLELTGAPAPTADTFITSDNLTSTVDWGWTVEHLLTRNRSAFNCNDKAFVASSVTSVGGPGYQGEIFFRKGHGTANIDHFVPGKLTVSYATSDSDAEIAVNTNSIWGWSSESANIQVVSKGLGDIVAVRPAPGEGQFTLNYDPPYLIPVIVLFFAGCILFLGELIRVWRAPRAHRH